MQLHRICAHGSLIFPTELPNIAHVVDSGSLAKISSEKAEVKLHLHI